jgi:(p)ppGpp synthase/HD superfamily hydrolase
MLIEKSLAIALRAYSGKTDKAGCEYIKHPLRIMAKMDTDEERSVALLHDVIEDSDISAQELCELGIPQCVVDAVVCLTKQSNENYHDFIGRVQTNKLATKVKLADIEDNINVLRLTTLNEHDLKRVQKYHQAWHVLSRFLEQGSNNK